MVVSDLLEQAGLAFLYYCTLIFIMRMAGKRLAGQTTTFDLIVLITLGVVLQTSVLRPGLPNAVTFVFTVFCIHKGAAMLAARSRAFRKIMRGGPRPLVRNGRILYAALEEENLSHDELLAGLRKLGYASPSDVRAAMIEETGHITAIGFDEGSKSAEGSASRTKHPPEGSTDVRPSA